MTVPWSPLSIDPELAVGWPPAARAVPFVAAAGGHLIYSGRGILTGWSNHNTDGVAGHLVNIRDGVDVKGQIIAISRMGVSAGDTSNTGPLGVAFLTGLFADDSSGLLEGVIWFVPM